jgi:hypothetical protein
MKVMVVFHLPEGTGLLHCMLTDLATVPAVRSTFLFRGNLYQVTRSIETLDRNEDGSRLSTSEQLLQLLASSAALNKKNLSLSALSKMFDVGDKEPQGAEQEVIKVTIKLAMELVKDADRVIMFDTEHAARVAHSDPKALMKVLLQGAVEPTSSEKA